MKKRLLITSIVMMLVVAVALSTATYAWFTSNASVTANNITISAATSNAPSLAVAWIPESGDPTYVTTLPNIVMAGTLNPIAPEGLSKTGTKSLASQNYYSATIRTESSVDTFNGDSIVSWHEGVNANAAAPYYLTNGTSNSIRLKNGSTVTNMSAVTISADITGSAAKLVRIAVYKYDGSSNWELVDVLGYNYTYTAVGEATFSATATYYVKDDHDHYVVDSTITSENYASKQASLYTRDTALSNTAATATYGEVTNNKQVSTMSSYTCQNSFSVGELSATSTMDLKVVIWLDGLALNDETQGFTGSINLTFSATSAS